MALQQQSQTNSKSFAMKYEIFRMNELAEEGFYCSQILLSLGLEALGKDNPDLIRAMSGLAQGIGFSGDTCGALTGGACLLGLYAGRAEPEEDKDPRLNFMAEELFEWFSNEYGQKFGGIRCKDILGDDSTGSKTICPMLVQGVYEKVNDLLIENGFDLTGQSYPKAVLSKKNSKVSELVPQKYN